MAVAAAVKVFCIEAFAAAAAEDIKALSLELRVKWRAIDQKNKGRTRWKECMIWSSRVFSAGISVWRFSNAGWVWNGCSKKGKKLPCEWFHLP
jgi:hypothetical protein